MTTGLATERVTGPVDQSVTYAINDALRRDAERFVAAVRRTPLDDLGTWRRLSRRHDLFAAVLRMQSQGQDSGLWPALRPRCTPEEAAVLDAMEVEHDALITSVARSGLMLARLAADPEEGLRAATVVRLTATREALERHLAHEEAEAMPVLQAWLTAEEWAAVDRDHYLSQMDLPFLLALVPWVAHAQPRDALERIFAQVGLGFRVVWWLTRGRFARRERRTFRAVG